MNWDDLMTDVDQGLAHEWRTPQTPEPAVAGKTSPTAHAGSG